MSRTFKTESTKVTARAIRQAGQHKMERAESGTLACEMGACPESGQLIRVRGMDRLYWPAFCARHIGLLGWHVADTVAS